MRLAIVVAGALVAAGCKDKSVPRVDPAAWVRIEELARPRGPIGPDVELRAALAIAEHNHDQWSDRRNGDQSTEIVGYAEGAGAVAALVRWFQADGGLVPMPALPDPQVMRLLALGQLAIDTATDEEWDGLIAGASLGHRMVTQGRTLLEAMIGLALLQRANQKAQALGEADVGWDVPERDELVRILAAEAVYSRDMLAYMTTPEGHRESSALTGRPVSEPLPPAMVQSAMRFWIAALDGATRDEPAATTVERVRKAAAAAGSSPVLDLLANKVPERLEEMATLLAELSSAR